MTITTLARAVVAPACDRDREAQLMRRTWWASFAFLVLFLGAGIYALLAGLGVVPAAPWSALG